MPYNPDKHHRRSIRLKGHDYSQEGIYFLTLCVKNRTHLFGTISNGKMNLNPFGEIAKEEWIKSMEIRGNITLGEFRIMPNHMHGIIQINYSKGENNHTGKFRSPSQTIGAIIRGYKGVTTKRIKILIRKLRTGESQFAPFESPIPPGESQFRSGELQIGRGELQFTPTNLIKSIDLSKSIWQRDYYDIIIRDRRAYDTISNYIINNPENWTEDNFHKT